MENHIKKYKATSDILFKRIFGFEGNEDITRNLVSSILGRKIEKLSFKNPIQYRKKYNDKEEIFDVKMILDNDTIGEIDMQMVNYHDEDKRFLDYWARMFLTEIERGKNYKKMKKTVVILITDYEIDSLKLIENYQTRWKIMEETLKIPLTNVFELVILELPKAEKALKEGKLDENKNLKEWVKFFTNPFEKGESRLKNIDVDEELKKAYEILEELNANAEEREKIERRIRDLRSLEYAKEYEYNQGLSQGLKKGKIGRAHV